MLKRYLSLFMALVLFATMLCACTSDGNSTAGNSGSKSDDNTGVSRFTTGTLDGVTYTETSEITEFVKIEMEDGGIMIIELYPDKAPITAANYQKLVSKKFYDGLIFHRVIEDFMIQGGDPDGDGTGGSGENIKGEFSANGIENPIKHVRGTISMGRTGDDYNSASSQFFICHKKYAYGDGQYAAFGMMIAGWDTLDAIATTQTVGENDRPLVDQKMRTVRFVTVTLEESSEEAASEEVSSVVSE